MGYRIGVLLIDKEYNKPFTELTQEIGLGKSKVITETAIGDFPFSSHPRISMGYYQGKTIISHSDFANAFYKAKPSKLERKICQVFNDCPMLLLTYRENAGDRGFALFNNGERIRVKLVEEYEGTIVDMGTPLDEEKKNCFTDVWYKLSKRIVGKYFDYEMVEKAKNEIDLDKIEMVTLELQS
jgi:hypothetical protein